jgi:hypothetical protein
MEIPEKRVFGALFLLLGVSFLSIAIYTGQVDKIVEMLKTAFKIVTP